MRTRTSGGVGGAGVSPAPTQSRGAAGGGGRATRLPVPCMPRCGNKCSQQKAHDRKQNQRLTNQAYDREGDSTKAAAPTSSARKSVWILGMITTLLPSVQLATGFP
jgi:hypothetical protein